MREAYVKTCHRSVQAAGTAELLEDGIPAFYCVKTVTIRAMEANTGDMYLGDSNRVSATDYSYHLAPGESVTLDATDLGPDYYIFMTQLWIDAATSGNELCFIAISDLEPW